ncbi:MAG: hypothetical protein QM820_11040 [Minicystis sp.]
MPGRLRVLSVGAKILYSAFVIATLAGLLVSWRLYGAAVGDAGPAVYYAGAAKTETTSAPAAAGDGPAIQLAPEDAKPRAIVEQMPERKLLEVTHFHLFSIPVYVLILAHLWLLAKIPQWLQHGGVVAAVATSALHIAAPWIVRGRAGLAFLMGSSGAAMLIVLGLMGLWSMIDMWLPNPKASTADMLAELRKKRASASSGGPGSPA